MRRDAALVLFSGGQDSTTCLAWALERFDRIETIGFDYEQRHHVELECRQAILPGLRRLRPEWDHRLGRDHLLRLPVLAEISETALTRDVEINVGPAGLPSTFVPGRNILFLTIAAALAYGRGIREIVTGVCETDYSGYPDCRDDAIKALQVALNAGMDSRFVLHTPLMWSTKADTWALASSLGGRGLLDLVRDLSHTCYRGERSSRHEWGYGCGTCPACEIRAAGYGEYVAADR